MDTTRGRQMKELRWHAGYSQEALAEKLGVRVATVSRWENGHTTPRLEHWERMRRILGIK